jgi:N-acetylglucosaminyl-diphospho-decaprenol L-rhamnosyltransferase
MPEKSSLNDHSPATVKCSVIIVSFNQFELLKAAIGSLEKDPPPFPYEIIVVDNHSSADVQEFLNDYFHDIRIIRNPSNRGFGWANNRGVQAAQGEYLLFLNSDAEITGAALARMVGVMEREATIGVLGPMLLNSDGSFQLSFGRKISLWAELYQKSLAPFWEKWKLNFHDQEKYLKNVDWVSGACLLTRRELFAVDPVFDEEMFLYFEDHDLCLRVKTMGRQVVYCPRARVIHHLGGSQAAVAAGTRLEYRKSQLYLYGKYLPSWQSSVLRRYLVFKFRRQLRRARDENGKRAAAGILELLKEK